MLCAVKRISIALAAFGLLGCKPDPQDSYVVGGGRWIDVETGAVADNHAIVVRNGLIEAILAPGDPVPRDLDVLDATGFTILPGIMDSHVHLIGQDKNGTTGLAATLWEVYRATPYKRQTFFEHGVTSLRDPGGVPGIDIRDRIDRGEVIGPKVYAAGPFLYAPNGYPSNVVDPQIFGPFVGVTASDVEGGRAFVRDRVADRADFIKVIYTSGVFKEGEYPPDADRSNVPDSWFDEVPILLRDVLFAVVEEADEHGLPVAVHLNRFDEAQDALEAGAHWIHHCWHVPEGPEGDAFFLEMAMRGACLDPTLLVHQTRLPEAMHAHDVRRAWELGVTIDVGTDIGFAGADSTFGSGTWDEMHLLYEAAGLPPLEVLRAATINGARCMGVESSQGSIAPGKRADLLLVDVDPLVSFPRFTPESIRGVLAGGVLVRWEP